MPAYYNWAMKGNCSPPSAYLTHGIFHGSFPTQKAALKFFFELPAGHFTGVIFQVAESEAAAERGEITFALLTAPYSSTGLPKTFQWKVRSRSVTRKVYNRKTTNGSTSTVQRIGPGSARRTKDNTRSI